jgi:hypothetical protein
MSDVKMTPTRLGAPDGYYTEQHQTERLRIHLRTLRAWRRRRYGPAFVQVGRFVYYHPTAEREFLASCEKSLKRDDRVRRRTPAAE